MDFTVMLLSLIIVYSCISGVILVLAKNFFSPNLVPTKYIDAMGVALFFCIFLLSFVIVMNMTGVYQE